MKNTLIFSLAFLCLHTAVLKAQWTNITPPNVENLMSLSVIDQQKAVLMATDSAYFLLKTIDGGTSWQPINAPVWTSSDHFYWQGIQFLDENTGFAYGNWLVNGGVFAGGTENFFLYRTTDGGNSWTYLAQPVPAGSFANINSIYFFNASQGVVSLTTGLGYSLIKTSDDGGASWQTRDTITYWNHSEHFNPDGTGAVILYHHDFSTHTNQYYLYKVEDFGKKWTEIGEPGTGAEWSELRKGLWYNSQLFVNDTLTFRTRSERHDLGPQDDVFFLDKSTDAGLSWQENYFSNTEYSFQQLVLDQPRPWIMTWKSLFRLSALNTGIKELPGKIQLLHLSPNPVAGGNILQIQLAENFSGPATLRFYSNEGKLVHSMSLSTDQGKISIKAPQLSAGLYNILFVGSGKTLGTGRLYITGQK